MLPEIDFSNYKATSGMDWLDIGVSLERHTQFQYVQGALHELLNLNETNRPIHVEAQNVVKKTDSANVFVFRLQENHHENNAAKIAYIVRGLADKFGFIAPARIAGVEIACDLRPKKSPEDIYPANAVLQGCIAAYGERARQYTPSARSKKGRAESLEEDPKFSPQGSLYVGHQDDQHGYQPTPKSHRAYPKITDGLDKAHRATPLPPNQHRARVEVTLQLEALEEYGLTDPLTLNSYDFSRLAGLLHFRCLKPIEVIIQAHRDKLSKDLRGAIERIKVTGKPISAEEHEQLRWRVKFSPVKAAALTSLYRNTHRVIEWQGGWKGSEGRPLQHSKDTEPMAELNRKVKAALCKLSKSMRKGASSPKSGVSR